MSEKNVRLPEMDVRQLVEAALQIGKDRTFADLTDDERERHLDALVTAAVLVALDLGIEVNEEELWPPGRGPSGGNYI